MGSEIVNKVSHVFVTASPHLLWILGLLLIGRAFYPGRIPIEFEQHPQALLLLFGIGMFFAGREAISYRKKYRREKRRADRLDEYNNELIDSGYGALDEGDRDG